MKKKKGKDKSMGYDHYTFFQKRGRESYQETYYHGLIKNVLSKFTKYKILGPDGWPMEIFIYFFDIIEKEILEMVEFSRRESTMFGSINSTFTSLIPKKIQPMHLSFYTLTLV